MACPLLCTLSHEAGLESLTHANADRYGLLAGAAFCQGMTVGPLVSAAVDIDPVIPLTAFLATSAVFACFSAAALLARRRSYLFLGGVHRPRYTFTAQRCQEQHCLQSC